MLPTTEINITRNNASNFFFAPQVHKMVKLCNLRHRWMRTYLKPVGFVQDHSVHIRTHEKTHTETGCTLLKKSECCLDIRPRPKGQNRKKLESNDKDLIDGPLGAWVEQSSGTAGGTRGI